MNHSKMKLRNWLLAGLLAGLFFASCKKDDNTTEQENITTIEVHLTGTGGFEDKFFWRDLDGSGGSAPEIDTIVIPAQNLDLNCHIHVYDESKNPVEDITEEIEEENTDHLFTYLITGANLTVVPDDVDNDGAPFNLETVWKSGAASTGTVRIRLFHEPSDKTDTNNPGGEVDLDVTFPVKIQ